MTDPRTSGRRSGSPEWQAAWDDYWLARRPFDRAVEELRNGDGASFGVIARYLGERPRFLQSGYIAERMLRYLSRVDWADTERTRLERLVRVIAAEGRTREAHEARLLLARWDRA